MYISSPHGTLYSFCPGKATWDSEALSLFNTLVVVAETGKLLEDGGLNDQPDWFVSILAWFLPAYDELRFGRNARMVFGDGGEKPAGGKGGPVYAGSQPMPKRG